MKINLSINTINNLGYLILFSSSLDENTEYIYRVRAYTAKGPGPWSSPITVHTPGDVPTAPTNVQAMATSEQTVEVWWDQVPYFLDILGYKVSLSPSFFTFFSLHFFLLLISIQKKKKCSN